MVPDPTSPTLLARLRERRPEAWRQVVRLYGPLVAAKCRQAKLSDNDAEDVLQEVFAAVARALPNFQHDRRGDTFRGWLATITQNKIRDYFRRVQRNPEGVGGSGNLQNLHQCPDEAETEAFGSESLPDDHVIVVHRAAELVRNHFEEQTWAAFWLTTAEGLTPAAAAERLNTTVNAVYQARSRVLRRLRQEFAGLI